MVHDSHHPPPKVKGTVTQPKINWILGGLLLGRYSYLAKRPSPYRKREWCIYDGKASPLQYFGNATFTMISELLKEDKIGRHTLDLRKVRALHGNHGLKKLYKRFKKSK